MGLRDVRGTRLRRAARGRAGFVALASALYLAAGAFATWPAVEHSGSSYLAGGAAGNGEVAPGDHLQTGYHLWLVGHQLGHGRAPWRDPYEFRPEAKATWNFAGWPLGLPYWPLVALLGGVRGWNAFVLLTYVGAGALACWWLRSLGLARGAALTGGLAFALAPYRVAQSVGHLLGPVSMLLPLALLGVERGRLGSRPWLAVAVAATASIPLAGQVHLALGTTPFIATYALVRSRRPAVVAAALVGVLGAVVAGLLVQRASIAGSLESGGRSLDEVRVYSAGWLDLVSRRHRSGSETFVYVGWATPALALVGLVSLARARSRSLAALLGLGTLLPILLALGANLPLYRIVRAVVLPFRFTRVPERLMPIACLCLAALAALAVDRLGRKALVTPLVVILIALDLHVHAYGASRADPGNRAYAAIRGPGRLLELPVFLPDVHLGSTYLAYSMQSPRERPGGYSTTAPVIADAVARKLRVLDCGGWSDPRAFGVRFVTIHRGLSRQGCAEEAAHALRAHGFHLVATDGAVSLYMPIA